MILIVASKFDKSGAAVVDHLVSTATETLENIETPYQVVRVPGAVEIPIAVQRFVKADSEIQAVIALGCVIQGESDHYKLVTESVTQGLTELALKLNIPIIQGVLACHNAEQAKDRIVLGSEFAETALDMINILPPLDR